MRLPLRCIADVKDLLPAWLWPGRIPAAALTLVCGDAGRGKSLLTIDVAARVTTNLPWPDGQPSQGSPGDVLMLAAEDSIAGTVRQRLVAHDADLRRVHYLKTSDWSHNCPEAALTDDIAANGPIVEATLFGCQPMSTAHSLARDAYLLTGALDALPNCRLVIIDPIPAYLHSIDRADPERARTMLAPLTTLAERSGAAIVAVAHRDESMRDPSARHHSALRALAAMSRAIYLVDRIPDQPSRRIVLPIKNNLAESTTALSFDIVDAPAGGARLQWLSDPVPWAGEDLPGAPSHAGTSPMRANRLDRSVAWLEGALAAGPVLTRELEANAARAGISDITLRRARARLGITTLREKSSLGGRWLCALPATAGQPPDQVAQSKPMSPLSPLSDMLDSDELLQRALTPSHDPNLEPGLSSQREAG